jgi:hypothetical protein
MIARSAIGVAGLVIGSLGLQACMSAPAAKGAPAAEPAAPASPAPGAAVTSADASGVAGELAALARAEAELAAVLGLEVREAGPPAKGGAPGKADARRREANDGCATACRALASMTRSADHVCSMTNDGDARCQDARTRVKGAGDRVRASCPGCP